jgi:hypothetical protein
MRGLHSWLSSNATREFKNGAYGGYGGYSVVNPAWILCGLRFENIVNVQGAITIVDHAASMLHEATLFDTT